MNLKMFFARSEKPAVDEVPACFNSVEQFQEWQMLAIRTGISPDTYCVDCTPGYRARMKVADRCAHDVEFHEDEDGAVYGIRIAKSRRREIWEIIKRNPGCTARELGELAGDKRAAAVAYYLLDGGYVLAHSIDGVKKRRFTINPAMGPPRDGRQKGCSRITTCEDSGVLA